MITKEEMFRRLTKDMKRSTISEGKSFDIGFMQGFYHAMLLCMRNKI